MRIIAHILTSQRCMTQFLDMIIHILPMAFSKLICRSTKWLFLKSVSILRLVLVECDGSAFQELRKNCSGTLAQPIHARSEDALEYIEPDQTVIVDPPRAGCDAKLIEKLLEIMPPSIIYLSCNPITQARDVHMLEGKYHITKVQPYNFFPHTPHLENLMVLELNA